MSTLTPREIVAELDKYVVGQEQAKRMVAVAVRNRWRRQRLSPELRDEVAPKNIIMMGPTGVGKTEIARRLARLSGAPFIKVEATKFTEVGYVGRDVESMVRDLMEVGIKMVRDEENARVKAAAESAAESRLLDLLLPGSFGGDRDSTREKLRQQFRLGFMDDKEVEMEVVEQPGQTIDMFAIPGMEQMGSQLEMARTMVDSMQYACTKMRESMARTSKKRAEKEAKRARKGEVKTVLSNRSVAAERVAAIVAQKRAATGASEGAPGAKGNAPGAVGANEDYTNIDDVT